MSGNNSSHKDKTSRNRGSSSQQTTLQMSHSPTSKSQMYYDGTASRSNGNGNISSNGNNTQEYRSNGRSRTSRESNGHASSSSAQNNNNSSSNYDRYDRNNDAPSSYPRGNSYTDRAYSLPRQQHLHQQQQSNMQPSGYYTQDRRDRSAQRNGGTNDRHYRDRSREDPRLVSNGGADTPDFYFMPSQRKYSGEVVRVYVDYNKDPKN